MPTTNPFRRDHTNNSDEQIQRRALRRGTLVDVSDQAREIGLDWPVALSRRLFRSLVEPFPSSGPGDCLPLNELLKWVHTEVLGELVFGNSVLLMRPRHLPHWVSDYYLIRVQRVFGDEHPSSLVLLAHDEVFQYVAKNSSTSLPASLLVRLARTVDSLMCVSRACDVPSLDHISSVTYRLVGMSPLQCDVHDYVKQTATGVPSEFSPQEYRAVLLTTLDELVSLAEAVASGLAVTRLVESLRWRLRVVTSRLTELVFLVESMLCLAATLRRKDHRIRPEPFEMLLTAYVAIQKALGAGQTVIAASVVSSVRKQLAVLEHYGEKQVAREVAQLRSRYDWLGSIAKEHGIVDLARSRKDHAVQ